jgi:hypothetical protein
MDFGSIFLILALLLLVVLFISRPFLNRRTAASVVKAERAEDHRRSALLAERDRLLTAVKELDFDYALGKIPEEDYPYQRKALLHNGAEVMKQLDEMSLHDETRVFDRAETAGQPASGRQAVEASEPLDELEELILQRRRSREEKASGFCPRCGKPLRTSDKFCAHCGAEV